MGSMTVRYYEQVKDYVHPHIHQIINYYMYGDITDLPLYHGLNRVNRNETRKEIQYNLGHRCIIPTYKLTGKKQRINTKEEIFTGQDI